MSVSRACQDNAEISFPANEVSACPHDMCLNKMSYSVSVPVMLLGSEKITSWRRVTSGECMPGPALASHMGHVEGPWSGDVHTKWRPQLCMGQTRSRCRLCVFLIYTVMAQRQGLPPRVPPPSYPGHTAPWLPS